MYFFLLLQKATQWKTIQKVKLTTQFLGYVYTIWNILSCRLEGYSSLKSAFYVKTKNEQFSFPAENKSKADELQGNILTQILFSDYVYSIPK